MHNKFLMALVFSLSLASCDSNLVFSDYEVMENASWKIDNPVEFEFSKLDSVQAHDMFINIRNDNTFQFNNLFLITELEYPNGNTLKDTLEYKMAEVSGEWLGKGLGSIKENKLWFHEKIVFKDSGVYRVSVSHAMRKNGAVDGIHILNGITDVGLEIEKSTQ
ncbi:gliding motility lipoprotein GldH [Flagellimonas aquimarina]|uniref:Gliding motility lipoprotein GldH n=1 Tax=Flagellimonas aquimarina TaxID=2201895 RepID=A0A316L3A8_9FLAO|nr:gliding motility lipoprotein GldH [Allomuricauda koreensis]PWL40514.1 gliding motility lipoprotein GldH [Allomuricauda koreensis]